MVKATVAFLTTLSCVAAYPGVMGTQQMQRDALAALSQKAYQKRDTVYPPYRAPVTKIDRPNTGLPPSGFNAKDQYVDVTDSGPNPWKAPGPNDTRGQCPGLNAAANHGFLDRSGYTTITQGEHS
jgi:hypothetical protein